MILVRKLAIDDVKEYIESLSNCKTKVVKYLKYRKEFLFECECGNTFNMTFKAFKRTKYKTCRKCSKSIRSKISSLSSKKRFEDVNERFKCGNSTRGKRRSDKIKQKQSLSMIRYYKNLDSNGIENRSKCQLGKHNGKRTDAQKLMISVKTKEAMKRPDIRKKMFKFGRETNIEKIVEEQLKKYNIEYKKQLVKYDKIIHRNFIFDFYLPEHKLVVECNGTYWHNLEKNIIRDKLKEEFILRNNKKILWLWDKEIEDENFNIISYLKKERLPA